MNYESFKTELQRYPELKSLPEEDIQKHYEEWDKKTESIKKIAFTILLQGEQAFTPEEIDRGFRIWNSLSNQSKDTVTIIRKVLLQDQSSTTEESVLSDDIFHTIWLTPDKIKNLDDLLHQLSQFYPEEVLQDLQKTDLWKQITTPTESDIEGVTKWCESQYLSFPQLLKEKSVVNLTGVKQIDKGGYSTIYEIDQISINSIKYRTKLALKYPELDDDAFDAIQSEIRFIQTLHEKMTPEEKEKMAPNVHSVTYHNRTGYLTELYDGNLLTFLKDHKLSLNQKIEIATQLIEQMAILSKYGAIYVDIKPQNILIKKEMPIKVVFADFGNCHFIESRNTIPGYGFNYSERYFCLDDFNICYSWTSMNDQKLKEAVNRHQARALGLLFCTLFSEKHPPFKTMYSKSILLQYIKKNDPLLSLKQRPELHDTVMGMLGLRKGPHLMPIDAWANWKH